MNVLSRLSYDNPTVWFKDACQLSVSQTPLMPKTDSPISIGRLKAALNPVTRLAKGEDREDGVA